MNDISKAMRMVFEAKIPVAESVLRDISAIVKPELLKPITDLIEFYQDQLRPDLVAGEKEYEEMKLRLIGVAK